MDDFLVHVATITAPYGIKGGVKLHSFINPSNFWIENIPLLDEKGKKLFTLRRFLQPKENSVFAYVEGIKDRNAAEALKGKRLFVYRSVFPATEEDEYYANDLIGLEVLLQDKSFYGRVVATYNFGAGDIIEIENEGKKKELYPFNEEIFPLLDMVKKHIFFVPPIEYTIESEKDEE